MKKIHIIGGGTLSYIRTHLALCAPAFGSTALELANLCLDKFPIMDTILTFTKLADPGCMFGEQEEDIYTNEDVKNWIEKVTDDENTKVIIMNAALCDFNATIIEDGLSTPSGRHEKRLKTTDGAKLATLQPSEKITKIVKERRSDIFLIGFKTTCGDSAEEMHNRGMSLIKATSCDLVLVNDVKTRINLIVSPEDSHAQISDRDLALEELINVMETRLVTEKAQV